MRSYWCRKESPPVPTFSQTGVLRPVPLRGRPSSFRKPASHEAPLPFPVRKWENVQPASAALHLKSPTFLSGSLLRSQPPWIPHGRPRDIGPHLGPRSRKPIKKGLWHHHRPFTVFRSLLQAIAQTPSPWRLPGSRLCKRHAAPAEKRPALPPGTGPSAVCSCCPGPPAGGCRRH